MKKIIILCTLSLFFTFGIVSAYTPSTELQTKLESAGSRLEVIISKKGENYRNSFLEIILQYKTQYNGNEGALYVLNYLYKTLQNNPTVAGNTSTSPNILLIIADDMGLDASPGYSEGTTKAPMPHLEDMIENGLVFENFWTAPTCTPTRSTMLTGKYGINTNVLKVDDPLSLSEKALQTYLPDEYVHAVIGKWHLSKDADHPNDIGIDHYAGLLTGGVKSYWDWTLTENGVQTKIEDEYITSKFTDLAIDWKSKQDAPWFLWMAYTAPHTPFHLPPTELHSQPDLVDSPEAIAADQLSYYHAMLESLDTEIGRLLDSMTQAERDNTLIIFMGDNGTPGQVAQTPYEKRKAKGSLYEGGINTPLVVSGIGLTRNGERETALINSADVFSTVLDLAGTGITEMHDSVSFAPLLTDANAQSREFSYAELGGEGRGVGYTIRNDTHKYLNLTNGQELFYDLTDDPYEETNLLKKDLSSEATESLNWLKFQSENVRGE